jgi:phage terminase large subunit-like protein
MSELPVTTVGPAEAVSLGAIDSVFFSHYFFQSAIRQDTPDFHRKKLWPLLDGPARKAAAMVFRGSAKTTLLRVYTAKRIAYTVSRTILYIGKSQSHAARSVAWLMRQVEFNAVFRDTFMLRPGPKWTSEECIVLVGPDQVRVTILALGITGSTRGVNVDDYRPDLIVVDDPSDEENTATDEQRAKTEDFILGSLYNSLAPTSESPLAKLVFLQTLLHPSDAISRCMEDPSWSAIRVSCFNEDGTSAWPARWSTDELMAEKRSFLERGTISLWMREMECLHISSAQSSFPAAHDQVRYYDVHPPIGSMVVAMAVDPVPPPSSRQLAEGLKRKDFEAWVTVGLWQDLQTGERRIYVLDLVLNKGHDPDWSVGTFMQLRKIRNPMILKAESVAYQATLKWLIDKEMKRQGVYTRVDAHIPDKRKKVYRIVDTIGNALSQQMLYFHRGQHSELLEQIFAYPAVSHDDAIEALSVAIEAALEIGGVYATNYLAIREMEKAIPPLNIEGACP